MSSCFGGIQKKFIEVFGGFIRVQHHSQVREMIVFFFFCTCTAFNTNPQCIFLT